MWQNMKGFMKALRIPSFGLFVALIGLLYDLWFAGLPYQDPTFEQQAWWDFHSNIANLVIGAGTILFIGGLLYALISSLAQRRRMDS